MEKEIKRDYYLDQLIKRKNKKIKKIGYCIEKSKKSELLLLPVCSSFIITHKYVVLYDKKF